MIWSMRSRRWFGIGLLACVCFLVWLILAYFPKREEAGRLSDERALLQVKRVKLEKEIKRLEKNIASHPQVLKDLSQIEQMLVPAQTLDEASGAMQQMLQEVFEKNQVQVQSYNVLRPASWQGIPMAQVEFRLQADPAGFAGLLRDFEGFKKLIRIENLRVTAIRRRKEKSLSVTLRVGTLFVDTRNLRKFMTKSGTSL